MRGRRCGLGGTDSANFLDFVTSQGTALTWLHVTKPNPPDRYPFQTDDLVLEFGHQPTNFTVLTFVEDDFQNCRMLEFPSAANTFRLRPTL